jgi:hypothetical protein
MDPQGLCVDANGFVAKSQENHRQQVIVTGMKAHVYVLQTAIDLHHHGLTLTNPLPSPRSTGAV